ncbi:MAG: FeoB-associated Cys-rich membrane protein [Erysipelotrichaceae bacterium]|nr:FeoB-associated Cys-rich membrane protein [Erysipelotrichaceae bacterium]
MKTVDIITVIIIAAIAALAIRRLYLNRKNGCCCGCAGCSRPCALAPKSKCCSRTK